MKLLLYGYVLTMTMLVTMIRAHEEQLCRTKAAFDISNVIMQRFGDELLDDSLKAPREENRPFIVGHGSGSGNCGTINNLVNTISVNLNQCCQQIENNFITTFSVLNELTLTFSEAFVTSVTTLIDNATVCFAMSLTAPQVITHDGYYCLANDVSGSFVIAADNVTLDLNSHTINAGGVTVQTGVNDAIIKNGTITNSSVGIVLNNTTHTIVDKINITQSPGLTAITATGEGNIFTNIYIDTVNIGYSGDGSTAINTLFIDGMTVLNTTGTGIIFNGGFSYGTVKNVNIANCGSNGLVCVDGIVSSLFSDIAINACTQYGIYINGGSLGADSGCDFINVSVGNMQASPLAGIYVVSPVGFRFISCVVKFSFGADLSFFRIDAGNDNLLDSCAAMTFQEGTQAGNYGFQLACQSTLIRNCYVTGLEQTGNSLVGFYSNGADNVFEGCSVSQLSGTQTLGVPTQVMGFQTDTSAFSNIFTHCRAMNLLSYTAGAIGFSLSGQNAQLNNCSAVDVIITPIGTVTGDAIGFQINAHNIILNNCIAQFIQNTEIVANFSFGFFIAAAYVSLYNCIADQCGSGHTADSASFVTSTPFTTNALLVNCIATNSDGYGFLVEATNSTFIGCVAMGHTIAGFNITSSSGTGVTFRDCTAMYNPGGGFNSTAGNLTAINCYGAHNSGGDFTGFPNVQAEGSASPVVGVNISA